MRITERPAGGATVALVMAMAAVLLGGTAPAQAGPSRLTAAQQSIKSVLDRNPGARQIDANTVQIREGVQFRAVAAPCRGGLLCLYDDFQYRGRQLILSRCAFADIGRDWGNDKIRSLQNHQSAGTGTTFWNWRANTSSWGLVGSSMAIENVPAVSAAIRTAEGVRVC